MIVNFFGRRNLQIVMDSMKVFLHFGNLEHAKTLLRYNRRMGRYLLDGYGRSQKDFFHCDPKLYHGSYAWTYMFLLGELCSASDVATEELVDKGLIKSLAISARLDIKEHLCENYLAVKTLWKILMSGNIKHNEKMKKEGLIRGMSIKIPIFYLISVVIS